LKKGHGPNRRESKVSGREGKLARQKSLGLPKNALKSDTPEKKKTPIEKQPQECRERWEKNLKIDPRRPNPKEGKKVKKRKRRREKKKRSVVREPGPAEKKKWKEFFLRQEKKREIASVSSSMSKRGPKHKKGERDTFEIRNEEGSRVKTLQYATEVQKKPNQEPLSNETKPKKERDDRGEETVTGLEQSRKKKSSRKGEVVWFRSKIEVTIIFQEGW